MQRYCQISFYTSIFVLPVSVEVIREAVAAVEMNMSGQISNYLFLVCMRAI